MTAVEYLVDALKLGDNEIIQKAKVMEEQQTKNFANWCRAHDQNNGWQEWTIIALWFKYKNNVNL